MKSSMLGAARLGTAGLAILLLAGCGRGGNSPDQPTAEERQKLDNIAAKADEAETFDTSADSLVLNEGAADAGNTGAAPNATAPAGANAAANAAAPR
jgi:hypothetical protein